MTKDEHIEYWIKSSNEDFNIFELLFSNRKYVYSFFIAHLSIEKILKAHWVKNNKGNIPPKVHNLINLVKQSKISLSKEQLKVLAQLNDFQIQGRYPDYKFKINELLTEEFAESFVKQFLVLRKWLMDLIL